MATKKEPKYKATKFTESAESSQSQTQQSTTSSKTLDTNLLNTILSGLSPQMTDEQLLQFAENLLNPQLNAALEASQQEYDATKLAKEQEIENLAATLARSITEQKAAYEQNMSAVENAALARGMGRSSYTMQTLANQGKNYAAAVQQLTEDNARQQNQIQKQISQAAEQNAQTQGRLREDYAANLAAKIEELRQGQRSSYDQNYMTAMSASMGSKSESTSNTTGSGSSMDVSGNVKDGTGNTYTSGSTSGGTNKKNTIVSQDVLK